MQAKLYYMVVYNIHCMLLKKIVLDTHTILLPESSSVNTPSCQMLLDTGHPRHHIRLKFFVQVTGTVKKSRTSNLEATNSTCSIQSKFLVPEKLSIKMHDRLAQLLVQDF